VSETLAEAVARLREPFPAGAHSPILPALRLVQERDGWLSEAAIREVADAVGVTPAICHAVASFYDMFALEPVGTHLIEVCTNISCALVGAQRVVEAFEESLGVRAGETTSDGEVTLRLVECLGGCGRATVVAVDRRYHEGVDPERAAEIVRGLRERA
jgi:NADH-quinone oxidoreductase subunit E